MQNTSLNLKGLYLYYTIMLDTLFTDTVMKSRAARWRLSLECWPSHLLSCVTLDTFLLQIFRL